MLIYQFTSEQLENGSIVRRPKINVRFAGKRSAMEFLVLIDSGSDVTILPRSIADFLGIVYDYKSAERFFDFSKTPHQAASGKVNMTFHDDKNSVQIDEVPVLIALSGEEKEPVLGCEKIFDNLKIIFDKRQKIIIEQK